MRSLTTAAILLLASACSPTEDIMPSAFEGPVFDGAATQAQLAPPASATLTASALVRGGSATFTATGMPPGQVVFFVYSAIGQGRSCPSLLGGDCLDLAGQPRVMGSVDADRAGIARLTLRIPRTLGLSQVSVQAVALGRTVNTLSNAFTGNFYDHGTFPGPSCNIDDIGLAWPLPGTDARDWVINNYVDLDPTGGVDDFLGGSKSYDGHRGIDIDVPTFRAMDADFPVIAAFPGEVIAVTEDNEDRHTSCTGSWNVVKVRHANGFEAFYGHIKRDSAAVSVGDMVQTGDMLGVVGSSGCSTHPHLHFALHDCDDDVIAPFLAELWNNPPAYDTSLDVMDTVVRIGGMSDTNQIKDPDPNPTVVQPGATIGIGLSMAGGDSGDSFVLVMRRPDGSVHDSMTANLTGPMRHHFWRWNRTLDDSLGLWQIEVQVGGRVRQTTSFYARSSGPVAHDRCFESAAQRVCWNVHEVDYQGIFDSAVNAGFKPYWVDVSSRSDHLVYDVIFRQSDGVPWSAWHGLDGADHQSQFDLLANRGYNPIHVDGAMTPGGMRYVGIMEYNGWLGGWAAHHGINSATHQQLFDDYADLGMRPVNVAVADNGSDVVVTSLYDSANVGGWVQLYGLTPSDYQAEFDEWVGNQGMWVSHIDAYDDGGTKFSATWDSRPTFGAGARHGIRSAPMHAEIEFWDSRGLLVEALTTYGSVADPFYAVSAARR